nr:hypothetical protein [Tanacetum cinerariifolium]
MSEEDLNVDVATLPKFDMPLYESKMTAKDVKSLAIRHGIPLDIYHVALTKGWTMDQLLDDMIGLYEQYFEFSRIRVEEKKFFLDRRAIPDAMAWRHHDSDINDPASKDGFCVQDVQTLAERVIDLMVTMSEYLRFPFLYGASISKGPALTPQDHIVQHTTRPLSEDQTIPKKTDNQKRVKVEDPKIVATRERKARAAAKKKEKRRQCGDGGKDSHPTTKRRKIVAHKDGSAASEDTSSPTPLRTIIPTDPTEANPSGAATAIAESQEDISLHTSPHDSANHSVRRYDDGHGGNEETNNFRLRSFVDQSRGNLNIIHTEVFQSSPGDHSAHPNLTVEKRTFPVRSPLQGAHAEEGESSRGQAICVHDWSIHRRCRLDTLMWCQELMVHLAPSATQEESNALNNATALERAWFSLARGTLAQTDIIERFEHLQADFDRLAETHSECVDTVGKLVQARLDLVHITHLYTNLADRYKAMKSEHEGCARKLEVLENQNSEVSHVNKDQALRIKELEDELAKKYFALVYVKRESLSGPLNLAIQTGWATGLAGERFEEDLLELMSRMENFDAYADKKMYVEYDKLFEKRYPFVDKISRGFRHTISDLLKVYPDFPPPE